jgi:hypothetical protein
MSGPGTIEFEVKEWPPKKNEAKSLFAAGHSKAKEVTALLTAARDAVQRDDWSVVTCRVSLELTIYCPGRPYGDATNFLGGVADVLQGTTPSNVDISHLRDLAMVGLYTDDKQISQISYREMPAAEVFYRVRVSTLG